MRARPWSSATLHALLSPASEPLEDCTTNAIRARARGRRLARLLTVAIVALAAMAWAGGSQ